MAIRSKGIVTINDGDVDLNEFKESLYDLSDGEYGFLIFDKEKNKTLPQLKYLNGVVLKRISEELPGHPDISALYRYFEELYAPILKDEIDGETYEYFDLKSAKSSEMNEVIEKIIHHAKTKWNKRRIETSFSVRTLCRCLCKPMERLFSKNLIFKL